ncbi:GNAT family N-acetyltransferase [Natronorubrum texcoconense]|uniref:Putative acetyltransferase n=1 Tax=Natronorubrum texcoconense TaxID=1095776 RepID=A0A1G9FAW8_9EURY|nr:GNAT family N-acetyltransferase [Natronorubrum texcoconense]SDK85516.1 putative acetyltransferase [Natronorubrum texcoconense]
MAPARVKIREAESTDAESIADVHAASIRDLGPAAYDAEQVRAWLSNVPPEGYPLGGPDHHIVVAELEGEDGVEIAGFGLLDCDPDGRDDSTGEIGAVYVHPDHVREGIGRAILEALESAASDAGLETLVLTASRNAIEFYRRQGYEGVETVSLEMEAGVGLECLRMRTAL